MFDFMHNVALHVPGGKEAMHYLTTGYLAFQQGL
jgi:hypothetical protein